MATWEERIHNGNPIHLHNERFLIWHKFIDEFKQKYERDTGDILLKLVEQRPPSDSDFENAVVALGNAFSKITLVADRIPLYIFDASFGSLDPTSDLDLSVLAIDTKVIEHWVAFLSLNRTDEHTFTAYYDSNFYFEPSILTGNRSLVSLAEHNLMAALSKNETMYSEMERIEAYALAYISKSAMTIDNFKVYPNPLSPDFNQDAEIQQYKAMTYCGHLCFENYSPITVAKLASTKSEGLVSVGSLVICGVFGRDVQMQFILDKTPMQAWRMVAAFEMLYNIKMHQHIEDEHVIIKSKYLTRLNNVLMNSNYACHLGTRNRITRTIVGYSHTKKTIALHMVLNLINAIVEDETNEDDCPPFYDFTTPLDECIEKVRVAIIKRAPSNSLRSQFHTFAIN